MMPRHPLKEFRMDRTRRQAWSTVELIVVMAICVSPFWFLAGSVMDGDELEKSGVGMALAGVAGTVLKFLRGNGDATT